MRGRGSKFIALGVLAFVLAVSGTAGAEEDAFPPWAETHLEATVIPASLPKDRAVPVGLQVRSAVEVPDGMWPPPLQSLRLGLDRDLRFDLEGIPTCLDGPRLSIQVPFPEIERECADATIGRGAAVVAFALNDGPVIIDRVPLIVVNSSRKEGPQRFLVLIDISVPVPALIVATALVKERRRGPLVKLEIPKIAAGAGSLAWLRFRIKRSVVDTGRSHPVLSASCSDGIFESEGEATYLFASKEFVRAEQRVRKCGSR